MKRFPCCRAFQSANGTLRKRIRDYSNTESIFLLTVHLAWLEISDSAQEMSLYATYYLSSLPPTAIYSAITALHQTARASCPTDSPAFLPRCFSACHAFPWWCFLASALSTHRGPNQAPLPSKACLNIPIFSAFCSSQLLPDLQSYWCVRD